MDKWLRVMDKNDLLFELQCVLHDCDYAIEIMHSYISKIELDASFRFYVLLTWSRNDHLRFTKQFLTNQPTAEIIGEFFVSNTKNIPKIF